MEGELVAKLCTEGIQELVVGLGTEDKEVVTRLGMDVGHAWILVLNYTRLIMLVEEQLSPSRFHHLSGKSKEHGEEPNLRLPAQLFLICYL